MTHRSRRVFVFLSLLAVFWACSGQHPPDLSEATAPPAHERPLRVVLFIDKSLSMRTARVRQPAAPSFAPIYDRLKRTGGELAIGVIGRQSNTSLVRLYVAPPPPEVRVAAPKGANVFAKASARKRADKEHAAETAAIGAWRAETARRIRAFSHEVGPILAEPVSATTTDIKSAAIRANLFAEEPSTFAAPAKNVIVFVSDGIGTANRGEPLRASSADVEVLVVNGVGTIGDFAPLHVTRFESVDAAIRYAATAGGRDARR